MEQLTSSLTARLRQEMARDGGISFRRFMELALYCPETGYYQRSARVVGQQGDFVTSVSSGPLFGRLLAAQFADWCANLSGPVQWIEAGAHDGRLARDILEALHREQPDLAARLEYWILEPSPARQRWQETVLNPFSGKVRWFPGVEHLPAGTVRGVIFANELLDAFPVHRLAWEASSRTWREFGVCPAGSAFDWCLLPSTGNEWAAALRDAGVEIPEALQAILPDGFTIEISPEAAAWWRAAGDSLASGTLLTLDYGLSAHEILAPERSTGTLRSYARHTVSADVLTHPGEQDITAHVNFTQLQRAGEQRGLRTDELVSQGEFLTRIASRIWTDSSPPDVSAIRQFRTLTHPEHLGRAFRVLIQSRPA